MATHGTHPDEVLWHRLVELTGGAADVCYQCDACAAICRWNLFDDDGPELRSLIVNAEAAVAADDELERPLWRCTTCGSCEETCPSGVEISDVIVGLRAAAAEYGRVPEARENVLRNVWLSGNPEGVGPWRRTMLEVEAAPIPTFEPGQSCLLYLGSPIANNARLRGIAEAMRLTLSRAQVRFGSLEHEPESGAVPRMLGEREYFDEVVAANAREFDRLQVHEVVTLSPHDYDIFRRFYADRGMPLRVFHASQYLAHLVRYEILAFAADKQARVIYHDPCYLGRHHAVYRSPRRLLEAMPGLELLEFEDNRDDAVCCGGGGGRIWLEPGAGESFASRRVMEALERDADCLATACPYCIQMFEEALDRQGSPQLKVCHVVELAASWGPYAPLDRRALEGATA